MVLQCRYLILGLTLSTPTYTESTLDAAIMTMNAPAATVQ